MIDLMKGNCLERMKEIHSDSIDMILTDPPYGTTACKWDSIIDLDLMWEQLKRIIKPNGAIVMTASQPFTSVLVSSNIKQFKYDWVWHKTKPTNVLNAKKQPLRNKEDVVVFYKKQPTYNPQGVTDCDRWVDKGVHGGKNSDCFGEIKGGTGTYNQKKTGYPRQVLRFSSEGKTVHPTQKPIALMEYLIKTYTNENDTVLDFTMGSGTTGVAAKNLNRNFIGIELDQGYFDIAKNRINNA
ncbi:DNA methylase [Vibrio phage 1.076.O._10N.286.51.B7]|nr:DNA methylase [Vibrio phage 1.076.O._10N.286.51.B7]